MHQRRSPKPHRKQFVSQYLWLRADKLLVFTATNEVGLKQIMLDYCKRMEENNINVASLRKGPRRNRKTPKYTSKHWSWEENQQYVQFLAENKEAFGQLQCRRSSKIFLEMSLSLGERTSGQCRTHHQKVMGKYKNLTNIFNHYLNDLKAKTGPKAPIPQEPTVMEVDGVYEIKEERGGELRILVNIKNLQTVW